MDLGYQPNPGLRWSGQQGLKRKTGRRVSARDVLTTLAGRKIELPATICNTQRLSITSSRLGVHFDEPTPAAASGLGKLIDDLAARRIKRNLGKELRPRY